MARRRGRRRRDEHLVVLVRHRHHFERLGGDHPADHRQCAILEKLLEELRGFFGVALGVDHHQLERVGEVPRRLELFEGQLDPLVDRLTVDLTLTGER